MASFLSKVIFYPNNKSFIKVWYDTNSVCLCVADVFLDWHCLLVSIEKIFCYFKQDDMIFITFDQKQ